MYETKLKEGYLIPATFDIIFKELFTSLDTRNYAVSVLSNITGIPKEDLKNNMVILNNELSVETYKDKKIIGLYDGEKMDEYERRCRLAYAESQGMEKGIQKNKIEIAKNMLNNGISDELIISCTNITQEELKKLK